MLVGMPDQGRHPRGDLNTPSGAARQRRRRKLGPRRRRIEYNEDETTGAHQHQEEDSMSRRFLGIVLGAIMALSIAGTTLAGSCSNLSRPPAACGFTCTTLMVQGN